MSNKELYRNTEGYADPTAYATLSQKEPRDIWSYNDEACLIIKNHGRLSTILRLLPQSRHPNNIEVMTKDGPMYADQRLLTFGMNDRMSQYIDTVSTVAFAEVIRRTEEALGINLQTGADPAVAELRADLEAARDTIEGLERQLGAKQALAGNALAAEIAKAQTEAMKARNQLELLREMYNELLAKVAGEG